MNMDDHTTDRSEDIIAKNHLEAEKTINRNYVNKCDDFQINRCLK